MPLKIGNVKQSKVGSILATDTTQKALFTLPAQAQVTNVRVFGTANDATGVISVFGRPINSATAVQFAQTALTAAAAGIDGGIFIGTAIPYNRQSVPLVITASIATPTGAGPWAIEVEYM